MARYTVTITNEYGDEEVLSAKNKDEIIMLLTQHIAFTVNDCVSIEG